MSNFNDLLLNMRLPSLNRFDMPQKKKDSAKSPFVSITLSLIFLGLSAVLIMNSVKSVTTANKRMKLIGQAEGEVGELRLRNLELMQKKEEILGEEYVETEARDRLYYTRGGEIMVVLPDTGTLEVEDEGDGDTEDQNETSEYGWSVWWQLIRDGV